MSTLARITLGRLVPLGTGGGGVVVPAVLDVSIAVVLAAQVASPALMGQVNQPLAITVSESMLAATVQSPLMVEVETIQVEVDLC